MARFFARFDGAGSPNPGGSYNQRTIAAASASGAPYKVGLLASRSAISTDFLAELESVNRSGGAGIYFPPDLFVNTAGVLTASAYTSSATDNTGIRTPADYATRPTASITSSTHVVGPTNPLDSGSVTYNVYLSGSNAVLATLNAIQPGTPYDRLGLNPSRTLHSIFHNPTLDYFAWDDFTPGTASNFGATITPQVEINGNSNLGPDGFYTFITSSTPSVQFLINWTTQFLADATMGTAQTTFDINWVGTPGGSAVNGDIDNTAGAVAGAGPYDFTITDMSKFNRATGSGNNGTGIVLRSPALTSSLYFTDATIPSHVGATVTEQGAFSSKIVKLVTPQRLTASMEQSAPTSLGQCFGVTPGLIHAVYSSSNAEPEAVPADNVAGSNTANFIKLFTNLVTPAVYTAGVTGGQVYWLVQTTGTTLAGSDTICKYDGASGTIMGDCQANPCGVV